MVTRANEAGASTTASGTASSVTSEASELSVGTSAGASSGATSAGTASTTSSFAGSGSGAASSTASGDSTSASGSSTATSCDMTTGAPSSRASAPIGSHPATNASESSTANARCSRCPFNRLSIRDAIVKGAFILTMEVQQKRCSLPPQRQHFLLPFLFRLDGESGWNGISFGTTGWGPAGTAFRLVPRTEGWLERHSVWYHDQPLKRWHETEWRSRQAPPRGTKRNGVPGSPRRVARNGMRFQAGSAEWCEAE